MAGPVVSVIIDDTGDLPAFTQIMNCCWSRLRLAIRSVSVSIYHGFPWISNTKADLSQWFDGVKINGNVMEFDARASQFLFSIGLFFNDR